MTISVVDISAGGGSTAASGSLTFSHTVSAGDNRILIVGVAQEGSGVGTNAPNVNYVTYNGVEMTKVASFVAATSTTSGYNRTTLYEMIAPPVGTADIRVVLVNSSAGLTACSFGLQGAKQQTAEAIGAYVQNNTAGKAAVSSSITTVTANAILIDLFSNSLATQGIPNAGQTYITGGTSASSGLYANTSYKMVANPGITAHGWTVDQTTDYTRAGLFAVSYAPAPAAVTPGEPDVTLDAIPAGRVFQQTAGVASVSLSGTYTGNVAPTDVQAQIRLAGGIVVDYTTLTNLVINGGIWSGKINVPEGGMYSVYVRTRNGTTVLKEVNNINAWGVGDIFALIGSSTPAKWVTDGGVTTANPRMTIYNGSWRVSSTSGVGCNIFAAAYQSIRNVPVAFLDYGIGGTELNDWYVSTYAGFTAFQAAVVAVGGKITGLIHHTGGNDARREIITSQASHETRLRQYYANIRAVTAAALPIVGLGCLRSPDEPSTSDKYWQWARGAEQNVSLDANNYLCVDYDLPLIDNIHATDGGTTTMAKRAATHMLTALGLRTNNGKGPILASAIYTNTTVRAKFTIRNGTGLVCKSTAVPLSGFQVSDNDFTSVVPISDAKIVSSNEVDITVPSGLTNVSVRYMYGRNPDVTNPVYDNSVILP